MILITIFSRTKKFLLISFITYLYHILDCESPKYIRPSLDDYMSNDAVYTAEAGTAKSSSRDAGGTPNKKNYKKR